MRAAAGHCYSVGELIGTLDATILAWFVVDVIRQVQNGRKRVRHVCSGRRYQVVDVGDLVMETRHLSIVPESVQKRGFPAGLL